MNLYIKEYHAEDRMIIKQFLLNYYGKEIRKDKQKREIDILIEREDYIDIYIDKINREYNIDGFIVRYFGDIINKIKMSKLSKLIIEWEQYKDSNKIF